MGLTCRRGSPLNGEMSTVSKQMGPQPAHDFQSLFTQARQRVIEGPGDLRELQLALDGPPLLANSRLLSSGGFTFIRGENVAKEDLVLRNQGSTPMVALHAPLRGSAISFVDGLGAPITDRV